MRMAPTFESGRPRSVPATVWPSPSTLQRVEEFLNVEVAADGLGRVEDDAEAEDGRALRAGRGARRQVDEDCLKAFGRAVVVDLSAREQRAGDARAFELEPARAFGRGLVAFALG